MTAKMRRSGVSSVPIPEDCREMLDASFSSITSSIMTTQEGANCCYNYDNNRNRSSFSVSSSCISTSARSSVSNDKIAFGNGVTAKKPHKAHDRAWEAIRAVRCEDGSLGLKNFRLVKKIGSGDIGKVYLCELRGFPECVFAMKVVDKEALVHRNKLHRAEMERKILCSLDHPFLPTLYAHFEASQYSCLVMEYCARGDLHSLRVRQDGRRFGISSAKFYAAEVLVALEYLHMMGVVYRDLKPENVLVREDGHVMLSDFDLSFTCNVTPTLHRPRESTPCRTPDSRSPRRCFFPLRMRGRRSKKKKARHKSSPSSSSEAQSPGRLRQRVVVAEPVEARSRSFVGTHEYLAPEVILGRGHGAAVDWWALGIFIYEMLFGETPFKGPSKDATLTNIISSPLRFPKVVTRCQVTKMKWEAAQDLIQRLLCKDPSRRLGSRMGSSEIKSHPFFQGLNWALIRSTAPPRSPSGRSRDSTIKQRTQPSPVGCRMPPRPSNLTPRFKYF